MKFSTKVEKCGLSPMRKFHPYAVAAQEKGKKIYHLNIGQPDIETPKAYFDAVKHFDQPVLEYAPSPGVPELIEAIRGYYAKLNMHFAPEDILITNGGSEALQIAMNCILDVSEVDRELVFAHLDVFNKICSGAKDGGPIAQLDVPERFRWLTAVRSSCIQTSRPHAGFSDDLDRTLERLFKELVL